jgi:hypothetical protein
MGWAERGRKMEMGTSWFQKEPEGEGLVDDAVLRALLLA